MVIFFAHANKKITIMIGKRVINGFLRGEGVVYVSQSAYDETPSGYKSIWTAERWDLPNWETEREKYIGRRTIMPPFELFDTTCLLVEGNGMEIISDKKWKKLYQNAVTKDLQEIIKN